ncbi:Sucrase/ferredoxin-like-domain-containing protein [Morchella snyderi]|nr:Sucrase/ferredoxin-like-domain-containing protein [Morchella snyderi]
MPFAGLLRRGTSFFSATATKVDTTAGDAAGGVTKDTLFPLVTCEHDKKDAAEAEECDHDCAACPQVAPDGTSGYGRAFDKIGVDHDEELWGGVKKYSRHVIVATGEMDWIRDVEEIPGSVMEALKERVEKGARLMVSASNMPPPNHHNHHSSSNSSSNNTDTDTDSDSATTKPQPTSVILLPSWTLIENVTPATTPELNLSLSDVPYSCDSTVTASHYPHDTLILLCSHKRRDARCGISAPILRKEFERHLRPLGLWRDMADMRPGGVKVLFINHVGGHKFSANVIVYRKGGGEVVQGVWLAKVTPRHVEGIVRYTVLEGKVCDSGMIRAGFDRRTGLSSW